MGTKDKRAVDLANEVLRPLGLSTNRLTETTARDLVKQARRFVEDGKEDRLLDGCKPGDPR